MRSASCVLLLLMLVTSPQPASAQDAASDDENHRSVDLDATLVFYADNTEFANAFRTGETILGTTGRLFLEARVNRRLSMRAGIFVNRRLGSAASFDQVRPVLALVVRGPRSTFVFGTLDTMRRMDGPGPDRTGPHGLLPPVQRETLAFERPYEAGVQWTVERPRYAQDAWLNWQRVNTQEAREVFDIGLSTRARLRPALTFRGDLHVVHQGGQRGGRESPVADSGTVAAGLDVGGAAGRLDRVSLETLALVSRDVPDRQGPDGTSTGFATFYRVSIEEAAWRLHLIVWRADEFIKVEGDRLYQSIFRDGTRYGGLRDYGELGVTRVVPLATGSWLEASLRWHRVEHDDEWSFRILGVANLRARLPWGPRRD